MVIGKPYTEMSAAHTGAYTQYKSPICTEIGVKGHCPLVLCSVDDKTKFYKPDNMRLYTECEELKKSKNLTLTITTVRKDATSVAIFP